MRSILVCALAACSFDPQHETPKTTATIVDDDFATPALIKDGVVTPWGTLEPAAFVVGGLHARSFAGNAVDADDTYEDVAAKVTAQLGASYRQLLVDRGGNGRPRGLGLPGPTDYTLLYDGEIELPLGVQKLELSVDDRAIVQVATDGVTFGERLAGQNTTSITLDIRAAGWFPIRIAYGQGNGNAKLVLTTVQGMNRTAVGPERLRARVTDHPGLVTFAFDALGLLLPVGESTVPTIDAAFAADVPAFDLDFTSAEGFSLRHTGQLRVDTQGTYAFRVAVGPDADDQYRLWIDGSFVASSWPSMTAAPTASIELAPGWHDLVFDYGDSTGNAEAHLLMTGPGLAEAPIDPAHLRPAIARGLVATHLDLAVFPLADNATTPHALGLDVSDLAVIDFADYGFGLQNQLTDDLAVDLADCMPAQPLAAATATPALPAIFYFAGDARCAGMPAAPAADWELHFVDSAIGNGGFIGPIVFNPALIASYHGGEREPFARAITFISAPIATPGAVRFGTATVTADARGASLELSIRSAADEAALETTPWTVVPSGSTPALPIGAVVQYQLALGTDGWQYPSVDKVEIEYVTASLE